MAGTSSAKTRFALLPGPDWKPENALATQIIGIAGALETGHGFRKFVEGGVKLGGAPGKLRLESIAPPRYRPLDGRSEKCRGRDLLCEPGILRPDQIEHQRRFLAFRQHLAAALAGTLPGPPIPRHAGDLAEVAKRAR